MVPTPNPIEAARAEERLERIEDELEELNTRLDAIVEAVRLLAPQHYSPPWSDNRLVGELHRAASPPESKPLHEFDVSPESKRILVQDDDRR